MKITDINPSHGLPTITTALGETPDVIAWRRTAENAPLQNKVYWPRVAAKLGLNRRNAVYLSYFIELAMDPSLQIDPTPEAVAKLRAQGERWERIGIRAGLAPNGEVTKAANAARDLYEQGTGNLAATDYCGTGRNFAEMLEGPAKPTPTVKHRLAETKRTRKAGVRGDKKVYAVTVERIAEQAEAKRQSRKAKTTKEATA